MTISIKSFLLFVMMLSLNACVLHPHYLYDRGHGHSYHQRSYDNYHDNHHRGYHKYHGDGYHGRKHH